jgi:hypothetical protein
MQRKAPPISLSIHAMVICASLGSAFMRINQWGIGINALMYSVHFIAIGVASAVATWGLRRGEPSGRWMSVAVFSAVSFYFLGAAFFDFGLWTPFVHLKWPLVLIPSGVTGFMAIWMGISKSSTLLYPGANRR